MNGNKKKKGSQGGITPFMNPMQKSREEEEAELEALKQEIEEEAQKKDSIEWQNAELEKSVRR